MGQASNQFLAHYILIHNLQIFYWQVGSILGITGNGRDWEMQHKLKADGSFVEFIGKTPGMAQVLWAFHVVKCCVIQIWEMAPMKHQDEETGVTHSARQTILWAFC